MRTGRPLLLSILATLLLLATAHAQDSEFCLMCHEDTELTKIRGDRVVSLYIDLDRYEASVHGQQDMACIDCHTAVGLMGSGTGLDYASQAVDIQCSDCHDPHSLSLRAPGNGVCVQCHQANKYDNKTHHFHQPDSTGAACVEWLLLVPVRGPGDRPGRGDLPREPWLPHAPEFPETTSRTAAA